MVKVRTFPLSLTRNPIFLSKIWIVKVKEKKIGKSCRLEQFMIMIFCHQTMHVIKKKNKNKNRSQNDCLPPLYLYVHTQAHIYTYTYSSSFSAFLILFLCFTAAAVSLAPGHGTCLSYYRSLLLHTHYSCGSSPSYFRLYMCTVPYLYCSTLRSQRRHVCVVLFVLFVPVALVPTNRRWVCSCLPLPLSRSPPLTPVSVGSLTGRWPFLIGLFDLFAPPSFSGLNLWRNSRCLGNAPNQSLEWPFFLILKPPYKKIDLLTEFLKWHLNLAF
jgi:hypothetical protein